MTDLLKRKELFLGFSNQVNAPNTNWHHASFLKNEVKDDKERECTDFGCVSLWYSCSRYLLLLMDDDVIESKRSTRILLARFVTERHHQTKQRGIFRIRIAVKSTNKQVFTLYFVFPSFWVSLSNTS